MGMTEDIGDIDKIGRLVEELVMLEKSARLTPEVTYYWNLNDLPFLMEKYKRCFSDTLQVAATLMACDLKFSIYYCWEAIYRKLCTPTSNMFETYSD